MVIFIVYLRDRCTPQSMKVPTRKLPCIKIGLISVAWGGDCSSAGHESSYKMFKEIHF
jgi:hypothetical protein